MTELECRQLRQLGTLIIPGIESKIRRIMHFPSISTMIVVRLISANTRQERLDVAESDHWFIP